MYNLNYLDFNILSKEHLRNLHNIVAQSWAIFLSQYFQIDLQIYVTSVDLLTYENIIPSIPATTFISHCNCNTEIIPDSFFLVIDKKISREFMYYQFNGKSDNYKIRKTSMLNELTYFERSALNYITNSPYAKTYKMLYLTYGKGHNRFI